MAEGSIAIVSRYLGAQWAGKSLKDWGKNVTFGEVKSDAQLVILDEGQESSFGKVTCDKIVLRDVEMSPQHILAQSSVLTTFGQQKDYFFPNHIVELVVSNGLAILALQILLDRRQSVRPETRYLSLVTLIKYFGASYISNKEFGLISKPRGKNILQGGYPYYSVYQCKEGYLAVGNLQAKFYAQMVRGLDLTPQEREFCQGGQLAEEQDKLRSLLARKFKEKTAREWEQHFKSYDTCITEIKSPFADTTREPKLTDLKPKL